MSTRVYVGRLPRDARKDDLKDLFRKYDIGEISMKNGFGFVEFVSSRDAERAVYKYHRTRLLGESIVVELAHGTRRNNTRSNRRTDYAVRVENLASKTTWQDLKDFMREAGTVVFADVSGRRDDEGVVEFDSREDMDRALRKLDNRELNGNRVRLFKERRGRRGSRSRSRSRSRTPQRRSRRAASSRSASRTRASSPVPHRRSDSRTPSRSRSRSQPRSQPRSRSNSPAQRRSQPRSQSPASDRGASPSRMSVSPRR